MYDAVLIPGGGLLDNHDLPIFVARRLERAAQCDTSYFITLSAGTTHKPLPTTRDGAPIYESVAAAQYLTYLGIQQNRILTETASYDTIGNAWFARILHVDPLHLTKLHVITSAFHLARTKLIFHWVFGLTPKNAVELTFESTPDDGIPDDALKVRIAKETTSMSALRQKMPNIKSVLTFHQWLNSEHGAYAWPLRVAAYRPLTGRASITY